MLRPIFVPMILAGAVSFSGVQTAPETFVIQDRTDTIAVERISRAGATLTGDLHLYQEKTSVHYVVHLRTDGSAESVDVQNEAPNFFTGSISFSGDAFMTQQGRSGPGETVLAPAGSLPVIGTSMGLIDHLVRLHRPAAGQTVEVKVLNIRNRLGGTLTMKRLGTDSLLLDCDGCMKRGVTEELRLGLARDGGIAGGARVEQHWIVTRH